MVGKQPERFDIHQHKLKLNRELNRIKGIKNGKKGNCKDKLSKNNQKLILKFYDECYADGLGEARIFHYLQRLRKISVMLKKDFNKAKKQDIKKIVVKLNKENYSEWTKHDYKVTLKKFFKFIRGIDKKGMYPEEVDWISTSVKNGNHMLPEELLDENDIKKLCDKAKHPRDKALIFVLYDSGCRVGELCSIKIKNCKFDDYGAILRVTGKTGDRSIRIIDSAPALTNWLNYHPRKDDPDSPVFVNIGNVRTNESMLYKQVRRIISDIGKACNIKKKVNPHIFRKSRATFLACHLKEAQLNQHFGWVQGSRVTSTYVHLSHRDVDNALLKLSGIDIKQKKEESKLKPRPCPRCRDPVDFDSYFCNKCGLPMSEEAITEQQKYLEISDNAMPYTDQGMNLKEAIMQTLKDLVGKGDLTGLELKPIKPIK